MLTSACRCCCSGGLASPPSPTAPAMCSCTSTRCSPPATRVSAPARRSRCASAMARRAARSTRSSPSTRARPRRRAPVRVPAASVTVRIVARARPAHAAKTIGRPLQRVHSVPRSSHSKPSSSGCSRSAGSPITSAASLDSSIAVTSGSCSRSSGVTPKRSRSRMRDNATDVRELESTANVRIWRNGTLENRRMLRTAPSQAMPTSGNRSSPSRSISAHGTSPICASSRGLPRPSPTPCWTMKACSTRPGAGRR